MMCGIEIHQRLAGGKLFCRCNPEQAGGSEQLINRRLHPVLSELGELDSAVRLESLRSRSFQYKAQSGCSCLVEADEEPPQPASEQALSSILTFCHLLGAQPVDRIHIMRKTVIDGSNTSGFQRTAVVGLGGSITTPSGKLELQTICMEEESAGILEGGKDHRATYDLSRLGIPLVEIATAPTLKSGKQAQEAALAIGTLLRQTGLVARGLGTIRQDLNVSIPEGARVEIKGVQDLQMIDKTVELEVLRQKNLLALASEMKAKTYGKEIKAQFVDLTEIFSETHSQFVAKQLKNNSKVFGMQLPNFAGFIGREISPNRRFGTELADYARSAGISGLIHSDEDMNKYGFSEDELAELRAALSIGKSDAFLMVIGEQKKAQAALSEIACRVNFFGVPEETRRANPDGTSSYMRPLPGKARLYPETDLPPIVVTKEMLQEAAKQAKRTEKLEEQKGELLSTVNTELAAQLAAAKGMIAHHPGYKLSAQTPELSVFSDATKAGAEAKFVASTITNTLASLKRDGINTRALDEPRLLAAFKSYSSGLFAKSALPEILHEMCSDSAATPESAVKKLGLGKITGKSLSKLIAEEKLDMKGLMAKYRLQVDAQEAQEIFGRKK